MRRAPRAARSAPRSPEPPGPFGGPLRIRPARWSPARCTRSAAGASRPRTGPPARPRGAERSRSGRRRALGRDRRSAPTAPSIPSAPACVARGRPRPTGAPHRRRAEPARRSEGDRSSGRSPRRARACRCSLPPRPSPSHPWPGHRTLDRMKSLGNFPDPFLAEIAGQPDALRRAATALVERRPELERIRDAGASARTLVFTGMGSSYDACYPAVNDLAGRGVPSFLVDTAELLHFRRPILTPQTLLTIVSQSGESAEIVKL